MFFTVLRVESSTDSHCCLNAKDKHFFYLLCFIILGFESVVVRSC